MGAKQSTFLASVVQAAPVQCDTPQTLGKFTALTADAARKEVRLVVFPEAFVGGYPKGTQFGTTLGIRTPEGREQFRRYFDCAIDVPSPATERLGQISAEHSVHLVIGVIEREGGTLYCTVLFFNPGGELLGKHRKLMPTALERII